MTFQALRCSPGSERCKDEVVKVIDELVESNNLLLILNPEHSLVNVQDRIIRARIGKQSNDVILPRLQDLSGPVEILADASVLKEIIKANPQARNLEEIFVDKFREVQEVFKIAKDVEGTFFAKVATLKDLKRMITR